jgi:D-alanyl-lipoteichoic acid acyltransferase DltB (MBOAT superfamily)
MDFSGAMDAVCGTGQIFGITMPENFQRPFFSKTISEFWTRWHISLGGFFKDYIFYPVTMSKSMKNLTSGARKKLGNHFGSLVAVSVALFCVWLTNGLWHGAGWNYIFFGMYHFVLILTGRLIAPWAKTFHEKFSITADNRPFQIFQILRICVLVVIGELFFRAEGLGIGLSMFGKMVTDFRFGSITHDHLQSMQISGKDFAIVGITLIFIFVFSLLNERGIRVREWLKKQPLALRWALLYVLIFYIITFGAYGVGYIPVDPMYANF